MLLIFYYCIANERFSAVRKGFVQNVDYGTSMLFSAIRTSDLGSLADDVQWECPMRMSSKLLLLQTVGGNNYPYNGSEVCCDQEALLHL